MRYASFFNQLRIILLLALAMGLGGPAVADWPWTKYEGSPRIDPFTPLGNRLPASYRRKYNRPTYLGGKLAAKVAPSSQEAIAFHRAESLGLYDHTGIKGWLHGKNCPPQRVEQHYFYPKPWEALAIGPRRDVSLSEETDQVEPPKATDLNEALGVEILDHDTGMLLNPSDDQEIMELPAPTPDPANR